eukprot:4677075-Lingulodinium_polyedra.AAC.1
MAAPTWATSMVRNAAWGKLLPSSQRLWKRGVESDEPPGLLPRTHRRRPARPAPHTPPNPTRRPC